MARGHRPSAVPEDAGPATDHGRLPPLQAQVVHALCGHALQVSPASGWGGFKLRSLMRVVDVVRSPRKFIFVVAPAKPAYCVLMCSPSGHQERYQRRGYYVVVDGRHLGMCVLD